VVLEIAKLAFKPKLVEPWFIDHFHVLPCCRDLTYAMSMAAPNAMHELHI